MAAFEGEVSFLAAAVPAFVPGSGALSPDNQIRLVFLTSPEYAALHGGDNAGFPNGRRPGDDVVDIELRVAMGVLCHAFPGVFCTPAQAPSGNLPFTDGTLQDQSQFLTVFPYLRDPIPGSPNGANGIH